MARVPIYHGKAKAAPVVAHALVDDADEPMVNLFRWTLVRKGRLRYARSRVPNGDGTYGQILMHRLVLGFGPDDLDIDHRDGDGLNNRRVNLRPCAHAQNMQNRRDKAGRYRGVVRLPSGRWRAKAAVDGRHHHVGTFETELQAAVAAEAWRREHMPFAEPDPALVAVGG